MTVKRSLLEGALAPVEPAAAQWPGTLTPQPARGLWGRRCVKPSCPATARENATHSYYRGRPGEGRRAGICGFGNTVSCPAVLGHALPGYAAERERHRRHGRGA